MLLVSTRHKLFSLDTKSWELKALHDGHGPYFGIAYDHKRIYVVERCQGASPPPQISVWNGRCERKRELRAPFALADMHQILCEANKLYICCAEHDMVAIYDLGSEQWTQWFPNPPTRFTDEHHFNSLWIDEGELLLLAHNQPPGALPRRARPSKVWRFDRERVLKDQVPLGFCSHSVWKMDGALYTLDSAAGRIRGTDGVEIWTHGFPRGIAWTEEFCYVGLSPHVYDRVKRDDVQASVGVFDRDWNLVNSIVLPDAGCINEIRAPFNDDRCTTMKPLAKLPQEPEANEPEN